MSRVTRHIFKALALWADAFTFELLFKRLFAPTSQSWMSNVFQDWESLGKSNGKKWF